MLTVVHDPYRTVPFSAFQYCMLYEIIIALARIFICSDGDLQKSNYILLLTLHRAHERCLVL